MPDSDSGDGHFVGAMPPQLFLDTFMSTKTEHLTTPIGDFSQVPLGTSIQFMCTLFIRAVNTSGLCPGIRLYKAKTTRRREEEDNVEYFYTPRYNDQGDRIDVPLATIKHRACPAIAARKQPSRRPTKKRTAATTAGKRDDLVYYDFANSLLDIEVVHNVDADPFEDPPEAKSHMLGESSSSRFSSANPSLERNDKTPPSTRSRRAINRYSPLCRRGVSLSPDSRGSPDVGQSPDRVGTSSCSPTPSPLVLSKQAQASSPKISSDTSPLYTSFERLNVEATAFRTRMMAHARAACARKHRAFLFQIVLIHRFARFVLWDRSGAVVSEHFDYIERPELLATFLWRFSHMSDEERGFDSSVVLANAREKQRFEVAVQNFLGDMQAGVKNGEPVRTLPGAKYTPDDSRTYPTWKIHVMNPVTRDSTALIVRRPISEAASFWGRATRAYVAYDLQNDRLLCLKDTWRKDDPDLRAEWDTYQDLKRHAVPNVPDALYGGDVETTDRQFQHTLAQMFAEEEGQWRVTTSVARRHIHHRLVQEIAYPLEKALDEKELIVALHDTLSAIDQAYSSAGLLHRDVSYGNVMITADGRGILNDWDHAGSKDSLGCGVGTWAFMSVGLLQNPDKLHDILDDLESVFWVLVYSAFERFLCPNSRRNMTMFDEESIEGEDRAVGGKEKSAALSSGLFISAQFTCTVLQQLIRDCAACWLQCVLAMNIESADIMASMKEQLNKTLGPARSPAFWYAKFTSALEQSKVCCGHYSSDGCSSERGRPEERKATKRSRKTDEGSNGGANGPELRRPKRTKL